MNRYLRTILGFFFLSPGGIILLTDSLSKTFRHPQSGFKMEGKRSNAKETSTRMKRYRHTTAFDPDATTDLEEKRAKEDFVRIKRKKVALMFAYSGVGYLGLQRNKGTKTIEGDIMTALLKANLVTEEIYNTPQLINFQRAARTDKGVSALKQIVSVKLPESPNKDNINAHLPPQIRIFSIKRVTKGFNSKNNANARTYSYTCPSYSFAVPEETNETYRLTVERLQFIQNLLKQFEGTHNFHNYTSQKKPKDPSALRFIMSFVCGEPFVKEGIEFITVKVKGQSFMLHQIRKMVAVAMSIAKGFVPIEFMPKTFEHEQYDLPFAPGHGLLLEQVHYTIYNDRYGKDGIHETLEFDEVSDEIEKFRHEFILPHIVRSDVHDKLMLTWLEENLQEHGFQTRAEKLEAIARGELPANALNKEEDEEEDEDDDGDNARRKNVFEKNERNRKTVAGVANGQGGASHRKIEEGRKTNVELGGNEEAEANVETDTISTVDVEPKSLLTKESVLDGIVDHTEGIEDVCKRPEELQTRTECA